MDDNSSALIIGLTQTCGNRELVLTFNTYQDADEAAERINEGGIKRVVVETAEGAAIIWCNYVAYIRILRDALALAQAAGGDSDGQ